MSISKSGFTLVELLIVIVVIGILAGIVTVSFSGASQRAIEVAMSGDLSTAAPQMETERKSSTDSYPDNLPSSVQTSPNVILQLTNVLDDSKDFCINAYYATKPGLYKSWDSATNSIRPYLCGGTVKGSAVGGVVPPAGLGVNLVADFSAWTLTGGITYNSTTKELNLNSVAGTATSPITRIDSPTSSKFTVESYATTSSPTYTPLSGVNFGVSYFLIDGSTSTTNTSGFAANGKALSTALSSWITPSWTTPAGTNVVYIVYKINSVPTTYTSNNRLRNPSVIGL